MDKPLHLAVVGLLSWFIVCCINSITPPLDGPYGSTNYFRAKSPVGPIACVSLTAKGDLYVEGSEGQALLPDWAPSSAVLVDKTQPCFPDAGTITFGNDRFSRVGTGIRWERLRPDGTYITVQDWHGSFDYETGAWDPTFGQQFFYSRGYLFVADEDEVWIFMATPLDWDGNRRPAEMADAEEFLADYAQGRADYNLDGTTNAVDAFLFFSDHDSYVGW